MPKADKKMLQDGWSRTHKHTIIRPFQRNAVFTSEMTGDTEPMRLNAISCLQSTDKVNVGWPQNFIFLTRLFHCLNFLILSMIEIDMRYKRVLRDIPIHYAVWQHCSVSTRSFTQSISQRNSRTISVSTYHAVYNYISVGWYSGPFSRMHRCTVACRWQSYVVFLFLTLGDCSRSTRIYSTVQVKHRLSLGIFARRDEHWHLNLAV